MGIIHVLSTYNYYVIAHKKEKVEETSLEEHLVLICHFPVFTIENSMANSLSISISICKKT